MPSTPAWHARYTAARDALMLPRLRMIAGMALAMILGATAIDVATEASHQTLHLPTRYLLVAMALLGLVLGRVRQLSPRVHAFAALGVLAAGALHVEGMILVLGDVGGSFPFLLLMAPLASLMLPATGLEVGVLAGTIVAVHVTATWFGRVDGAPRELALEVLALVAGGVIATWMAIQSDSGRQRDARQQTALDEARQRSDRLLQNILPDSIAEQLKETSQPIANGFGEVTILFADLVGFTPLAQQLPAERLVRELNGLFTAFDEEAERRGLEKIKTIGDCYMVAAGLPEHRADHAAAIVDFALWLRDRVADWPTIEGHQLAVRVGINTGPVVAGVIGRSKFIYDLWGDAVNVASRMESTGQPGMVQLTDQTRAALPAGRYALQPRENVEVKGKGTMRTWTVEAP